MFQLFGRKKSPEQLIKSCFECLHSLNGGESTEKNNSTVGRDSSAGSKKKAMEDLSKYLAEIKALLYGETEGESRNEVLEALTREVEKSDFLSLLIEKLEFLEFESRKDAGLIVNNLLRKQVNGRYSAVDYILHLTPTAQSKWLCYLLAGYTKPDIAFICGSILRDMIRHESLSRLILYSPYFYDLFSYVELVNFEVASDAFATFRDLLTKHKQLCAEFLDKHFEEFFERYTNLLNSTNFVTRKQSIKLLGDLLLNKSNFVIMTRYISSEENLKLMMNLLREKSKSIQFEAFHVFKVFVANPNKPKTVRNILLKNKERLVNFLNAFHNDKNNDKQFVDEKALLIKEISKLEADQTQQTLQQVSTSQSSVTTTTYNNSASTATTAVHAESSQSNVTQSQTPLTTQSPALSPILTVSSQIETTGNSNPTTALSDDDSDSDLNNSNERDYDIRQHNLTGSLENLSILDKTLQTQGDL